MRGAPSWTDRETMIQRKSFVSPILHVWSADPALDTTHPQYNRERFLDTGEIVYQPAKEGAELAVFTLRPLSRRVHMRIVHGQVDDRLSEAIAHGLLSARGVVIDEQPLQLEMIKAEDGTERLSPRSLDRLFAVSSELYGELALRIMALSSLSPLK